jgi:diguanylate cyclase (GGDEF)-like protein/PAS domain S-box-containing protein
MLRRWSIKRLLQLWSLLTVIATVVVTVIAVYTNTLYSATQNTITEEILPLETANRNITGIIAALFTLQNQAISYTEEDLSHNLTSHKDLEIQFEKYGQEISFYLNDDEQSKHVTNDLHNKYYEFLKVDESLLISLGLQHSLKQQLLKQVRVSEQIEDAIQKTFDMIIQQFSSDLERAKYNPYSLSDSLVMSSQYDLTIGDVVTARELVRSLRLDTSKILSLTQLIIRSEQKPHLQNIVDKDMMQLQSSIDSQLAQLINKVGPSYRYLAEVELLRENFQLLMRAVTGPNSSIYALRIKQFENDNSLVAIKKSALSVFVSIMQSLEALSNVINKQNIALINDASQKAKLGEWLTFIIVILIMIGITQFIRSMSNWVTRPLVQLRSAMHALSSKKFDTRIKTVQGETEFALLARDFNVFAENNQRLIDDLASAKDSLQVREQHISAILKGVPEAILTVTSTGVIASTNTKAERVLGAEEKTLLGLNLTQFFDPLEHIEDITDVANLLEISQEFLGRDYNNTPFSMWLSLSPLSDLEGKIWVCVISDISGQKKVEQDLRTTSVELDTILENAMVGIAFVKDRTIMRVNHKFEQLFACEREKVEGESIQCIYPSYETYLQLGEQAYSVLQQGDNYEGEAQLIRKTGEKFWCSMSSKAIDFTKPYDGSIWLYDDVTEQRENDEKLRRLASLDVLTELPNRGVFNDRLAHAVHKAHRNTSRLAVFFLDLDHFKNINDSLGHKSGDLLLCQVAQRLKSCVREGDTVARLGGDEFTVILEDVRSAQYVGKVAEKIASSVSLSYALEGTDVTISTSIGISLYPSDGRDVDTLIRNADAAMYHAKKNGRNNFQFYSAEMNAQAAERLAMETSLRRAVEQNEFYLNFQPQHDASTETVIGAEALLRWSDAQWGDVSPAIFVPILEDIGLITKVGEDVIKKACHAYMSLSRQLPTDFKMAVNLSGRQFHGGQLASYVKSVLLETGMSANNLELEITESILMDDADLAISTLNQLSDMGITMAIDDFGTGYSSLSYLKRFPLDVLKIDRSFVRDVTVDPDDAAIVDAILAMSRRLNLDVVAEGVETAEQFEFLKEHDCHRVQGYFLSKPLTFEHFKDYINQNG